MRINKKVEAFTILEVTLSMLLAAICIGITYSAYSLISRSYRDFDLRNKKISSLVLLSKLVKRDTKNSESIFRTEDGILLTDGSGDIYYTFRDDFIVRDQYRLQVDTFFVTNQSFQAFFENKEVLQGQLLDKLQFEIQTGNQWIPLLCTKQYSAAELMEGRVNETGLKE